MKAAVLHGIDDLRIEEVDKPAINDGEVLIKVMASGICGSDLPRVLGTASRYYPNILGHEFSGVVEETGKKVKHLKPGDIVSAAPLVPCHACEDCLAGRHALCKNYSFIGSRQPGAWAEYVKVPEANVVKLPGDIGFVEGAFLEPLTVALHGLMLMDFKPMSTVAITGMGTIGLLALQAAKLMGAREVAVFDVDDRKLAIAAKLGADHVVNTKTGDAEAEASRISQGKGFEMVVETAGVPYTELLCLALAASRGQVMYIGTPHKAFQIEPEQFEMLNRKELTVKGSWMSYSAPFPGKEWLLGAHYLGSGQIRTADLLDRVVPIDEAAAVFEAYKEGKVSGKAMLTF